MRSAIAVLLILATAPAAADITPLRSETSIAGESLDAFVVRTSRAIMLKSETINKEICGVFVRDGDAIRLDLYVGASNAHCDVPVPADYLAVIHTHLSYMSGRFSPADYGKRGYLVHQDRVCWQEGRGTEQRVSRYGRRPASICAASSTL